jgi:hypothetical protein
MGTDKMILTHVCNKLSMVIFPDRNDWESVFQPDRNVKMVWFRENGGTWAGVYGYGTRRKLSFSQHNVCH